MEKNRKEQEVEVVVLMRRKKKGKHGVGSREIRDKRKNKTKKDAMERKITSVYRDINKMEQQRAVMWRQK